MDWNEVIELFDALVKFSLVKKSRAHVIAYILTSLYGAEGVEKFSHFVSRVENIQNSIAFYFLF